MKKYLGLLLLILNSCTQEDGVEGCKPMDKSKAKMEMRHWVLRESFRIDPRSVSLSLNKFSSSNFPEAKKVADSALHIVSVLLSSTDFKTVMANLDFTCRNYRHCRKSCKKCSDRFSGLVALDSIYRIKSVKLDLFLSNCSDEYGHSTFSIYEVYSCKQVVFYDERELSPAYCYAYHLAHEYMHIVGFFHTNHIDDVAEKTGWIGWEILLRWRRAGMNVMQLKPGDTTTVSS